MSLEEYRVVSQSTLHANISQLFQCKCIQGDNSYHPGSQVRMDLQYNAIILRLNMLTHLFQNRVPTCTSKVV